MLASAQGLKRNHDFSEMSQVLCGSHRGTIGSQAGNVIFRSCITHVRNSCFDTGRDGCFQSGACLCTSSLCFAPRKSLKITVFSTYLHEYQKLDFLPHFRSHKITFLKSCFLIREQTLKLNSCIGISMLCLVTTPLTADSRGRRAPRPTPLAFGRQRSCGTGGW